MGRVRPDAVRVVEAAYAWEPDEGTWLDSLIESCARYDVGAGIVGYLVRTAPTQTVITTTRGTANVLDSNAFAAVLSAMPPALAEHALAPTEFVGNGAYRLSRIARGKTSVSEVAQSSIEKLPSMWALIAGDVRSRALVLCFPRRGQGAPDEAFPHVDSRALGLAGAHIGAALRLRALALSAAVASPDTEAVLTPNGKVLHATGAAATVHARESLTRAVLASERARTRTKKKTPEEALREWSALVQGRWTILDTIERDGKRLVLARRNRMRSTDLLGLSEDERDVVWLAALGHSYKYIAYEIGVPMSTVAGRLRRAMKKLGVASRTQLLQRIGVVSSRQK